VTHQYSDLALKIASIFQYLQPLISTPYTDGEVKGIFYIASTTPYTFMIYDLERGTILIFEIFVYQPRMYPLQLPCKTVIFLSGESYSFSEQEIYPQENM
jgi:hypothetical protein